MRYRFRLRPQHLVVLACVAAIVVLVYSEGWTWPLKAAAMVLPIAVLVG
jgi:hypothetical protein